MEDVQPCVGSIGAAHTEDEVRVTGQLFSFRKHGHTGRDSLECLLGCQPHGVLALEEDVKGGSRL